MMYNSMAEQESDDDILVTKDYCETTVDVEDLALSDVDENDKIEGTPICIDINNRIDPKQKQLEKLKNCFEADSCTANFQIGSFDFGAQSQQDSDNPVTSSEEFEISDDDGSQKLPIGISVSAIDLNAFVSVKTENCPATKSAKTKAQRSGTDTEDVDNDSDNAASTMMSTSGKIRKKAFHLNDIFTTSTEKEGSYKGFDGFKLSVFSTKVSDVCDGLLLKECDNDSEAVKSVDCCIPRVLSGQLEFLNPESEDENTDFEERVVHLGSENSDKMFYSEQTECSLRRRGNISKCNNQDRDSKGGGTQCFENANLDTDDETLSDEVFLPPTRKTRKCLRKLKCRAKRLASNEQVDKENNSKGLLKKNEEHMTDNEQTEEEVIYDNSLMKNKEWTETDESGGVKQVTQIKTETSIKVVGEHVSEDVPCKEPLIAETSTGQEVAADSPPTFEELRDEVSTCKDYRRESFREALELEDDEKLDLNAGSGKGQSPKDLPIQSLDISAVVKSQILNEELGQSIEDSPLEVKHISDEFEKATSTHREGVVYKQIKTEIFSQELGEDIESGSPERKDISPVKTSFDIVEAVDAQSELTNKEVIVGDESQVENELESEKLKALPDVDVSQVPKELNIDPQSPLEHIEHDDLEEYEEAKDEHSLAEQLLALASNAPQSIMSITDDDHDFLQLESTSDGTGHSRFDATVPHRSVICRKGKEIGYPRADKKEMRSLKTTKQVSTIEEHSSVESSDSPQELYHHDFSEDNMNTIDIKISDEEKIDVSTELLEDEKLEDEKLEDEKLEDEKLEYEKLEDLEETKEVSFASEAATPIASDLKEFPSDSSPVNDNLKPDAESPEDFNDIFFKKKSEQTFPKKLPSPPSDKSSKNGKKSDSDNEGTKLQCTIELTAPAKKDESFSSSGEMESHYYSAETSDSGKTPRSSPAGSRPCSSEFEINVLSGQGSEYETCVTSQDGTGEISGSYSTAATSQETSYSTACSSFSHSSRESAYSVDSESSGHLASVEISSEASETLVPSAQEMEFEFAAESEMPVLDEETSPQSLLKEPYDMEIPESVIRGGVELPFLKNWDLHSSSSSTTTTQNESMAQASQWPWLCTEHPEGFTQKSIGEFSDVTPQAEMCTGVTEMFRETSQNDSNRTETRSSFSNFIQQSAFLDQQSRESEDKQNDRSDSGRAHFSFLSETQSLKHTSGTSTEADEPADTGNVCIEEEQLSVSESSATHSEQTWQTSSMDTAVQLSSHVSASCVIPETQAATSITDSLSDIPPEVGTSLEQIPVSSEIHMASYLQLNGPVEVDYNPEYDAFDGDDSALQESQQQAPFQSDELQFELEEENDVPGNQYANGVPENEPPDDIENDVDFRVNGENNHHSQSNSTLGNASSSAREHVCVGRLSEAEKPEAQQEQEMGYRDLEDNLRSESVAFQDQTSYLPESDQDNLRSHASESFEQEPSTSAQASLPEPVAEFASSEALGNVKSSCESKMQSGDSVDKAEVIDTSPEDERYDCQFQKCVMSGGKAFRSSDTSETNDLLESDAGVYLEPAPELYTHQEEEDDIELKESDMFPSPIPEESKQSTPSFDGFHGRKFFPRSGDTSAASSLQEFERLEADIVAGRCSQASADSYEKVAFGKSVESDELPRRVIQLSSETSAASSLQEFERLEADIAAGRCSQASVDSFEKVTSTKSNESSDDIARRMIHHSGETSAASSLQEFERLEELAAAGRISRASIDSLEKPIVSKSGEHDDVSMCSLTEFEKLEKELTENEPPTKVPSEEAIVLSEIVEEGPECQKLESKIAVGKLDQDHQDSDESEYEKRMTEIEEIIKIAQCNVEKFHEETVEDLSEGFTYEEYTVTHTSESSQRQTTTDTDVDTVENVFETRARQKTATEGEETDLLTDSSGADNMPGGRDDSSNGKGDCMLSSTDSVDPSSSTATHATYQFETDSVMSSSINSAQASGEECTMVSSTDTLEPETKLTYSQGDLVEENFDVCGGGIISDSHLIQLSSREFPCDVISENVDTDKPQEMEMFLSKLIHKSSDDQKSSEVVLPSVYSPSMPSPYPDLLHHMESGDSSTLHLGQDASSTEISGLCQQDEGDGDEDVVSHTTTTTTRIITTLTTDDNEGADQDEQEAGDDLRQSMEAVLNQFMSEETPQDSSSQKH